MPLLTDTVASRLFVGALACLRMFFLLSRLKKFDVCSRVPSTSKKTRARLL